MRPCLPDSKRCKIDILRLLCTKVGVDLLEVHKYRMPVDVVSECPFMASPFIQESAVDVELD